MIEFVQNKQKLYNNPGDLIQYHIASLYSLLEKNSFKLLNMALIEGVYLWTWEKRTENKTPQGFSGGARTNKTINQNLFTGHD